MVKIKWSLPAVKDLEEKCTYIAQDSNEYARMFAQRIIETIESVAVFPLSGRVAPEMKNETIGEKIYSNYRIIYQINNENIEIVRIIHNARELSKLDQ
ncbi:type II toxin-antitoxin system RelE/ParE family toxin [Halalkalibacter alkaliphilus]|uniref:Type II toxin-antitoxin system RelE/ParE family toxin n=1 Tax=Halalkalibacter alkaliphilus TaxID=2917993 RepID=A0A9X2CUM9_9BACI|nr:type II toxin-antitoxin system RelE/ParE family toxin [Halalkalibacter alkaliphilus]MCL7748557.1 type II toxin-antitoxin system RelE/ParE family toxin [Halalkalibacter alkaliphilus]